MNLKLHNNNNIDLTLSFTFNTETPIPIPQVEDVTVTRSVTDGSPSLTVLWTAVSDGSGITYTVWYSTSSGTISEPLCAASTMYRINIIGTSTTLSELERDTRYYIWVTALSSGGQGPYSIRKSEITYTGFIFTILEITHTISLYTYSVL